MFIGFSIRRILLDVPVKYIKREAGQTVWLTERTFNILSSVSRLKVISFTRAVCGKRFHQGPPGFSFLNPVSD